MAGLLDIIGQALGMPTALAQQKVQYQQAQAMLQQYPQYAQTLQAINSYLNGGAQGQPSGGAVSSSQTQQPQSQTTQSQTGPVTTTALPSNDQAVPVQPGQQATQRPTGGLLHSLLNGSQAMINAAHPSGGLLAGSQGQQPTGGLLGPQSPQQPTQQRALPDPYQLARFGVALQGMPFPGAQNEGKALTDYATMLINNDPANATRMAAAKSDIAQDQSLIAQAQGRGDQTAAAQLQQKLLQDEKNLSVGQYNGVRSWYDPTTGTWRSINPTTGMATNGTQVSLAPGAASAIAQRAAAESGGKEAGAAPYDLVPVVGPDKQTYMVPKSALLNGGARSGAPGASNGGTSTVGYAGPGAAPAGAVGVSGQSPEQSSQQAAAGTGAGEELTELNKQAESARQANYTLNQLRQLGKGVSLGPAAPAREWLEQVATPLAQAFGMQPPKELANYQQINKFGNTLAFNAARAMGSREAAQIVQLQVQSNPQKGLVSDAYNGLIDSMQAMNNYVLAKNAAIQGAASGGQITARQATANWETGVDPTVWDLAVSPQLASRFSGQIGADKIAKAVPFMASEDAIGTMRNIPRPLQAQVLRALPPAAKQEILMSLQSALSGATGTY